MMMVMVILSFVLLSSHFFQFLILYEQYNNNDFDVEMLCCENYFCLIGCREWVSPMEFQITALGLDQIEWCFTPSARGSVLSMSEELKNFVLRYLFILLLVSFRYIYPTILGRAEQTKGDWKKCVHLLFFNYFPLSGQDQTYNWTHSE